LNHPGLCTPGRGEIGIHILYGNTHLEKSFHVVSGKVKMTGRRDLQDPNLGGTLEVREWEGISSALTTSADRPLGLHLEGILC
jgi:hypothetical protein